VNAIVEVTNVVAIIAWDRIVMDFMMMCGWLFADFVLS